VNEIIHKLNFSEYVFEIDGKNILNVLLKYSISEDRTVCYGDKHIENVYKPVINLEIYGFDNNNNEAFISFELNIGLTELNQYSSVPTNIINKVSKSEAFIKRPNEENSTFLDFEFSNDTIDDMYKNLSSIWVSKLDKNKFVFKICIPSENVFSYFRVDFNEK